MASSPSTPWMPPTPRGTTTPATPSPARPTQRATLPPIPIPRAPFPLSPPPCHRCGQPSTRLVTRQSNRNGNRGRPYYKCLPCGKFLVFADGRGNDPRNVPCRCGASSKAQLAGREKGWKVHFVCRLGRCGFYEECVGVGYWEGEGKGKGGERVVVGGEAVVGLLARLCII